MDAPQVDPAWIDQAKVGVAALFGGMVRMFLRPVTTLRQAAWLLVCCWTCGFYGTGPFMHWLELDPVYAGGVGATLGLVGLSFAEALLRAVDAINLKQWILKLLTKGEA